MKDDIPFTVDLDDARAETEAEQEAGAGNRSPFPPDPEAVDSRPGGKGELPTLTVSQLTRQIRGLLEESFPIVLVEGELSNVKAAASGHLYFNLKDKGAQIRCIMFRNAASSLRFELEDGLQAVLRGRLSVYEVRGEYQIQVLTLEPKGTGALQLAFEQLKRKLEDEGLFAPEAKQPIPFLPRRVGIVTSPGGAAVRDMLTVLQRRFPGLPVLVYPATVQGDSAAGEIAEGIAALNRLAPEQNIEVIIVGRGGGSVEDLWAFNTEAVARAIFASKVPVLSAVGHEVDFTIADFVADLRAPTPSAAAELAVPVRASLRAQVEEWRAALLGRLRQRMDWNVERWTGLRARLPSPEAALAHQSERLADFRERIALAIRTRSERALERLRSARGRLLTGRPDRLHEYRRGILAELEARLKTAGATGLERQRARLNRAMALLDSLSPLVVMSRGYAAVTRPDGQLLRSVRETHPGDLLHVRLEDGRLETEVKEVREEK